MDINGIDNSINKKFGSWSINELEGISVFYINGFKIFNIKRSDIRKNEPKFEITYFCKISSDLKREIVCLIGDCMDSSVYVKGFEGYDVSKENKSYELHEFYDINKMKVGV